MSTTKPPSLAPKHVDLGPRTYADGEVWTFEAVLLPDRLAPLMARARANKDGRATAADGGLALLARRSSPKAPR